MSSSTWHHEMNLELAGPPWDLNPKRRYSVIYADPAWSYRDNLPTGPSGTKRGAALQYKGTLSDAELGALPVEEIAEDDAMLFMWVTMPKLPIAFPVIESWGFTFKTCAFNWIKLNRSGEGNFVGLGRWTRGNAELCLLATRGKPKRQNESVRQIVETFEEDTETVYSPLTYHSAKPAVVRRRIEELIGDVPRIELFCRTRAPGWDCWGNEVDPTVQLSLL